MISKKLPMHARASNKRPSILNRKDVNPGEKVRNNLG